jgi:hypothetical protein
MRLCQQCFTRTCTKTNKQTTADCTDVADQNSSSAQSAVALLLLPSPIPCGSVCSVVPILIREDRFRFVVVRFASHQKATHRRGNCGFPARKRGCVSSVSHNCVPKTRSRTTADNTDVADQNSSSVSSAQSVVLLLFLPFLIPCTSVCSVVPSPTF